MIKPTDKILVTLFITFILSINILNILTPDKSFSEFENRVLAGTPTFNLKNLISGRFTSKFEEYVSDQFVYRNFWVTIKSDMERLTLKTENNGIYFGKDDFLLEDYKEPGEQLVRNINSLNFFNNNLPDMPTYYLLAPNSVKLYEDKLPLYASPYDQLETINLIKDSLNPNIHFVDVYETLNQKTGSYIYFKTDHHWTMLGAFYAYQAFIQQAGLKPLELRNFYIERISHSFYGTFYAKANNRHLPPDSIDVFLQKDERQLIINYMDTGYKTNSLYEYAHLEKRNQYPVFLDGNHSLVTIKSDINNDQNLIVFKDSYAHSLIPFLVNHYEEIHIMDLRYYKMNIYEYIDEHQINNVLFLYNVGTFSDDSSIQQLNIK